MSEAVIGIDIGGTKIAAHIADGAIADGAIADSAITDSAMADAEVADGHPGRKEAMTVPTPVGAEAVLDAVIAVCRDLRAQAAAQGLTVMAVGIGCIGQIDPVRGVVLDANDNIPGWRGTPVAATVEAALDLPVYVDNDVNLMALAESRFGAGRGYRHLMCLAVGTGIGGAIIINGDLWYGAHFDAGEMAYLYAEDGRTIEEAYAGPAIERDYAAKVGLETAMSLREIAKSAYAGNGPCLETIQTAAHQLGLRIAPVLALIDPEAVVVGGGVPEIGELWWEPFTEAIRTIRVVSVQGMPILAAQLGNRAGMIGAAVLATQKVERA